MAPIGQHQHLAIAPRQIRALPVLLEQVANCVKVLLRIIHAERDLEGILLFFRRLEQGVNGIQRLLLARKHVNGETVQPHAQGAAYFEIRRFHGRRAVVRRCEGKVAPTSADPVTISGSLWTEFTFFLA